MPARKKVAKKTEKKQLPVVKKLYCKAHQGQPCLARALMVTTIHEALASTVWHHRKDPTKEDYVVSDMSLILSEGTTGHFSLGVEVTNLSVSTYNKQHVEEMSLHKFFKSYFPVRDISINDCQA